MGWGKGGGKAGRVGGGRGGEGGVVPPHRGTWAEVEEPLFSEAADVGGNACFIRTAVRTQPQRRGLGKLGAWSRKKILRPK